MNILPTYIIDSQDFRPKSNTVIQSDQECSNQNSPIRIRERASTRRDSIRTELKLNLMGGCLSQNNNKIKKAVQLFKQKYVAMSKIGEGGNAVVCRCKKIDECGINYIVKIMKFKDTEDVLRQQEEYNVGANLNHPNIIKCYDFILEKSYNKAYIVQEYAKGYSLDKLLQKQKYFDEDSARIILNQTLKGVQYLHQNGICHRDLHCGNIIFNTESQKVKIIDFSISKFLKISKSQLMTQSGVVYFMAPEQFEGGYYDQKVDLWSIGVVLYVLLTGYYPFDNDEQNEEQVIESILKNEVQFSKKYKNLLSDQVKDFICLLLEKNPEKRIDAYSALQHPWFTQNMKQLLTKKIVIKKRTSIKTVKQIKTNIDDFKAYYCASSSSSSSNLSNEHLNGFETGTSIQAYPSQQQSNDSNFMNKSFEHNHFEDNFFEENHRFNSHRLSLLEFSKEHQF